MDSTFTSETFNGIALTRDAADILEVALIVARHLGYVIGYRQNMMGFDLKASDAPGALELFIRKDAKKDGALVIYAQPVRNSGTVYRPASNLLPGDVWEAPRIGVGAPKATESYPGAAARIFKAIGSRLLPEAIAYHAAATASAGRHNAYVDKIRANKEAVAKVRGVPMSERESHPDRECMDLHLAGGIHMDHVQVSGDTFKIEAAGIPMHRLAAVIAAIKGKG